MRPDSAPFSPSDGAPHTHPHGRSCASSDGSPDSAAFSASDAAPDSAAFSPSDDTADDAASNASPDPAPYGAPFAAPDDSLTDPNPKSGSYGRLQRRRGVERSCMRRVRRWVLFELLGRRQVQQFGGGSVLHAVPSCALQPF